MTPTRTLANEVGSPSLPQLLLGAMLRLFAELVLNVASTLRMRLRRPAVNATRQMPQPLPEAKTDTQQETHFTDRRAPARQSTRSVETDAAAKSPSVSRAPHAIHLPLLRRWRQAHRRSEGELPPSVHSTGGGGSPRLRGETEGESPKLRPITAPA